jgi:hypothetical protein
MVRFVIAPAATLPVVARIAATSGLTRLEAAQSRTLPFAASMVSSA